MNPVVHVKRKIDSPRSNLVIVGTIFVVLAAALWFQSSRFTATPAYAVLMGIFPQHTWSLIYLGAAVLKGAAIVRYDLRILVTITHTASIILLSVWWIAFVLRWLTDSGTTVVNVLSWAVFLYLAVHSALMADAHADADSTP